MAARLFSLVRLGKLSPSAPEFTLNFILTYLLLIDGHHKSSDIVLRSHNHVQLMHRLLAHHGLTRNFRVPALCTTFPLPSQHRRFNGNGTARPIASEQGTKRAAAPTVPDKSRPGHGLKGNAKHGYVDRREYNGRHKLTEESIRDADLRVAGAKQSAGTTLAISILSQASAKVTDTEEETLSQPERKYLRRVLPPKRFPPLLREIQQLGHDHKISESGRPQKSLDRSVASTEVLEAELRWVAHNHPHPKAVRNILKILVQDRKVKPSAAHYEALILANCFPELGSVENVKVILEEMEREGVLIEPSIYYAILRVSTPFSPILDVPTPQSASEETSLCLRPCDIDGTTQVLAVHPDTYLRTTIIQKLRQQWVSLPDQYAQLNVVAMIREGQLELATIELETLQQKRVPIPPWIWVIYVHAICDRQDFEALLQLLYKLSDEGFLLPRPTLLHLLSAASEHDALDVTRYIWHGYVETMHIMPNDDLSMAVLKVAAKHKDLELAESVAVVLESVAGDILTTPPSLVDKPPPTKHEIMSLTFDSPDLPEFEFEPQTPSDSTGTGSGMTTEKSTAHIIGSTPGCEHGLEPLARAFSTPLPLPHPSIRPRSRELPEEALRLLHELGIDPTRRGRNRRRRGILYPLFRKESGLRGARFDPRLALMRGWDWRKK